MTDISYDDFVKLISLLRKERNVSQKKLGEVLGVSQQTISRWERNKVKSELDNYFRLFCFLETFAVEEKLKIYKILKTDFISAQKINKSSK